MAQPPQPLANNTRNPQTHTTGGKEYTLLPEDSGIVINGWTLQRHKGPISSSAELDEFQESSKIHCPEMSFLSNHLTLRHAPSGVVLRLEPCAALLACSHQATAREPTPQEKATAATTLPGRPAGSHPAIVAAQSAAAAAGSKHPGAAAPSASRAPAGAGAAAPRLQVSAASKWTPKEGELAQFTVQQIDFGHDWTYTTLYKGDVLQEQKAEAGPVPPAAGAAPILVPAPSRVSPTSDEIKVEMLQRPDPILWYDSLPLFEDELHDNGVASLVIKVRVMPGCFLVLCQFWLRVDAVLMRVYDTRIFHEFGTEHIIREQSCREDSFDEIAKRGMPRTASLYTDPSVVSRKLTLKSVEREKISIAARADEADAAPADAASSSSAAAAAPHA